MDGRDANIAATEYRRAIRPETKCFKMVGTRYTESHFFQEDQGRGATRPYLLFDQRVAHLELRKCAEVAVG